MARRIVRWSQRERGWNWAGLVVTAALALAALLAAAAGAALAAPPTYVEVRASAMNGWVFDPDGFPGGSAGFAAGPAAPPYGAGSLRLQVSGTARQIAATAAHNGTRFDQITNLQYSTYQTTTQPNLAISLQFNVDYDLTDSNTGWQGRLIFEPYVTGNGTVVPGVWQTWNPLGGKWWASGAPGNTLCPQSAPCTWSQVKANWPNAGIHATLGAVILKAGGPWATFDGNADLLLLGINQAVTLYDFEPEPACTTVCYVDAVNGSDSNGGASIIDAKKTIQAAIDQVSPGGTVHVLPGTYVEQVTITKNLTIASTGGATMTTIMAPASIPAASNPNSAIVKIAGAGVTVEFSGFTVKGPGPGACGTIQAGIFVRDGANANIHDNRVLDIRDHDGTGTAPFSGCQNGIGILVGRQQWSTSGTATIANNHIEGYQKNGIVVSNTGSAATITGNTVKGFGAQDEIAQNGIQISAGATGSVSGNTVQDHLCNHASCGPDPLTQTQSAGILLFDPAAPTSISGNTVTNNDMGVYNYTPSGATPTIDGNTLTANRYAGAFLDQGNATVSNNDITGVSNIGIAVVSFNGSTGNSQGTVTNNVITTGGNTGIKLIDETTADSFIPTIVANLNNLTGNAVGIDNTTGGSVDGEKNWWGNITGPTHATNPGGTGVPVSNNVDFSPWLCSGTDTSPAVGFQHSAADLCPTTQGTVTARVFDDLNKSGTQEGSEANLSGITVFVDLDNSGTLTSGDLFASSTSAAAPAENLTITNVPSGPQVVCQEVGSGRFHTTGRCVLVDVPPSGVVSSQTDPGLLFGSAVRSGCTAGVVTDNVRAISLDGGATYFRTTNVTGPAAAPHLNTRQSFSGSNPVTYLRQNEFVSNGLLIAGVDPAVHPNLVLKYSYNIGKQVIPANGVMAADGTLATYLGSGLNLPNPLPAPGTFAWFDKNGEIYIFNVPTTPAGFGPVVYQDVYVITQVTAANSNISIKTTVAVAGKLTGSPSSPVLTTVSGSCGDSADSRTFSTPASTSVIDTNLVVDDVINKPN